MKTVMQGGVAANEANEANAANEVATQSQPNTTEQSALAGDRAAWETLITRHRRRVVVAMLARGLPLDRAEDLANEAWALLMEHQREGRLERLDLPGLAIKQATFIALEQSRRARARGDRPLEEGASEAELRDPAPDPERVCLSRQQISRAGAVLATCPESAREAFRLVYGGDGLTHAEAAKVLGLSEQRVRQVLCETRAKLRASMEDDSHDH